MTFKVPPTQGQIGLVNQQWLWLALVGVVGAMTFTAPHIGDFWWSDAPRHALNGVFLMDLLRDLPLADPIGYAKSYYAQYPALSILFYPPLFPVTEAPIFAMLGVSHLSAQLTVSVYWFVLLWAVWGLASRFLTDAVALAAVMLFSSLHELAFWGRQIMLEVPVYAWMVWAAVMYLRYLDTRRTRYLYALALFCVLALYTKQTSAFLVLVFAVLLTWETRGRIWRERQLWISIFVAALALIPLVLLTVKFGQVNVNATLGETGLELSRLSLSNWLYYTNKMPAQVGWPVLSLALVYFLGRWWRPEWRLPATEERLLVIWLVVGYIIFSLIGLKEARHSLLILLPLPLFAAAALSHLIPANVSTPAVVGIATTSLFVTLFFDPMPSVKGYDRAADYVVALAPKDSVVLFSGYRDGSFVFNMRSHEERGDLGVLRSDKLLLKVKVKRELGVQERGVTREELASKLNEYGVSYVVNQPNFWVDLEAMRMLQDLLHSPQFVRVAQIPVDSNVPHEDRVLEIYRNVQYQPGGRGRPKLELLIINQEI